MLAIHIWLILNVDTVDKTACRLHCWWLNTLLNHYTPEGTCMFVHNKDDLY